MVKPDLGQPLSDEAIGARVRELAVTWRLPDEARDARAWSDRVRRTDSARRGWARFGRVLGAGALAVALTIAGAAMAVWLGLPGRGGPPSGVSASAGTTASSRPRPTVNPGSLYSASPTTTPGPTLPAYLVTRTTTCGRAGDRPGGQRSRALWHRKRPPDESRRADQSGIRPVVRTSPRRVRVCVHRHSDRPRSSDSGRPLDGDGHVALVGCRWSADPLDHPAELSRASRTRRNRPKSTTPRPQRA